MIGWKYFAICVFVGLALYGLLMASLPLFEHFNCELSWQTVCDGPSWIVSLADAVTGISWLVILTFPISVVFFYWRPRHQLEPVGFWQEGQSPRWRLSDCRVDVKALMKKFCITRILSASLFLFGSIATACSPPSPTFDPTGKPVYSPEPAFRYEFTGVVVGETEGIVPARWNTPASTIGALRIRVVDSLASNLPVGSEHTLYSAGIGADCGFEAVSLDTNDFPVDSEVVVKSNDLVSGRVISKIKDPQPALDKAIRDGTLRKATAEDVRRFRDAYIDNKYTSKNLPVPVTEDALSVAETDLARAYVVLDKFTYPSGLLNDYRVTFFVPIGVPEPSGEMGHSAFYDFGTLTLVCTGARAAAGTGARTGFMSC